MGRKMVFDLSHGVFPIMEDAGRKGSICRVRVFLQHILDMLDVSASARGDQRHIDDLVHGLQHRQIEALLRPIRVHARQQDLSGAQPGHLGDPLQQIDAGIDASAVDHDIPAAVVCPALGVDGCHDALTAEDLSARFDQLWITHGR